MGKMAKIEQHVYTRARRTMFQMSEGYGTVAMSAGVERAFAKEKIHPYCVYPSQSSAERPRAITVVHYTCGKMLLGQAVYVEKDFTGQRAAFFAHNYILPPQMVGEILQNIERLRDVHFLTEYENAELKSLDELLYNESPQPAFTAVLNPVGADCDHIPLTQCVESSVYTAKKTYVIASQAHVWSILSVLYTHLAEEVKHRLGFCTYAREPVDKAGIHLIFLEPGAIKPTDPRFSRDFVFDLTAGIMPSLSPGRNYLVSFPPEKFFQEMDFLYLRIHHSNFSHLEDAWLSNNLSKLTMTQFAAIPAAFIARGKMGKVPELYVILGICKAYAISLQTQNPPDLRYLLGSYKLSAECRSIICKILQVAENT